ncbi:MAG TPA: methyltransferase domain-containing protein [Gaiellaceae bacterium]|nr:methyltransferase domain-containing protein [Gaiellaceae bacterium]
MTLAAEEVKACCAAAYSSAAARFLLGDCFHPGGVALTSQLALALRVGEGDLVVDVACGPGTSALQLARETGCAVIGVDLAPPLDPPEDPRVRFIAGDAEALPLTDASVDGALCECALCTFPDKEAAARELARVLRPGARLAISDLTARTSELPESLTSVQAWVACIADARPLDEIVALLAEAGLVVEQVEAHDDALAILLDRIDGRLVVASMIGAEGVERGRELVAEARSVLGQGLLGYGVVIARRP